MPGKMPILRVLRTKEEAQRSYDRLSRWYDLFSGSGEHRLAIKTLDLMNLPEGGTILEVGFGTGKILLEIARRVGKKGRVYGLDLSYGMCRFTRLRLEKAGVLERVLVSAADGIRVPIASDGVDAVFMGFTLELFDTPELLPVIRECLRILKPGGRMGLVTLSVSNLPGFTERLYTFAHQRWPRLVDCRPIDPLSLLVGAGLTCDKIIFDKLWGLSTAQLILSKDR